MQSAHEPVLIRFAPLWHGLCPSPDLFRTQAVLGISAAPTDSHDHPDAPLLNAGTRRQSACTVLLAQAHALSFEQGLMDEATIENLAALVALTQMSIFVELCVCSRSF